MRSRLGMPEGLETEIVAEMRDHITDSCSALEAEGLDPAAATREALARLGSPVDLGDQIRRAHQTTRRMLAGAAGGVFAMPGAYVAGVVVGQVPSVVALFAALGVFTVVGLSSNNLMTTYLSPVVGMVALAVGVFYAARTGVRVFGAVSRHTPASLGRSWAIVGTPLVAAYSVFLIQGRQSWPLFLAELLVPIAFAAGALYQVGHAELRGPFHWKPRSTVIALVGLAVVFGLVAGLALLPLYGTRVIAYSAHPNLAIVNIERAGPLPADGLVPQAAQGTRAGLPVYCDTGPGPGVAKCAFSTGGATGQSLSGWSDLRLEVWRGIKSENAYWLGGIAADSSSPTFTVPASRVPAATRGYPDDIEGTVQIGMRRDGPIWWIVLTGIGSDGIRYRLSDGAGVEIDFEDRKSVV
jgi:hypothetical protein